MVSPVKETNASEDQHSGHRPGSGVSSAVPGLRRQRAPPPALTGFDDAGRVTQVRRSVWRSRAVAGSGFALKEPGRTPEFVLLQVPARKGAHFAAQHDGLTLAATMRPVRTAGRSPAAAAHRPERCLSLRFDRR